MKPHKGLRKRVTVTARKKIIRSRAGAGHLLSGKSGRRRQKLRKAGQMTGANLKRALRALCME